MQVVPRIHNNLAPELEPFEVAEERLCKAGVDVEEVPHVLPCAKQVPLRSVDKRIEQNPTLTPGGWCSVKEEPGVYESSCTRCRPALT